MEGPNGQSQDASAIPDTKHGHIHAGPSQQSHETMQGMDQTSSKMPGDEQQGSHSFHSRPLAIDPYSRNLGRGKACEACRRRKLRCDGARPSCQRCVEARNRKLEGFRRKGLSEEELSSIVFPPCYISGEAEDGSAATSQVQDTSFVVSPEDRNNIFALAAQNGGPAADASALQSAGSARPTTTNGGATKKRRTNRSQGNPDVPLQNDLFFAEILSSHLPLESSGRANGNEISSGDDVRTIPFTPYRGQAEVLAKEPTQTAREEASTSLTVAYALAEPDVPLPPIDKLRELIDVCFEELHVAAIFHPGRLHERLDMGPDHPDYPHAAVLHIFAALAYSARPELDEGPSAPTFRSGAHYRHTMATRHHITSCIHMSCKSRALDIARAALLLVFKLYGMGDQMESYLAGATAVRMAISLNANREMPDRSDSGMQLYPFTLLQPRIADGSLMQLNPRDEIEAEEIRRMMLLVFVVDRTGIAATLWPGTISEEDYTAELPRATVQEFLSSTKDNLNDQPWTTRRNPLSLQSPDFFSRAASDPEQVAYKGAVLLGRCALYVSRLSRSATPDAITSSSRFQQLESWVAALHLETSEMGKVAAAARGASAAKNFATSATTGLSPLGQPARKAEGSIAAYLLASSGESTVYKGLIISSSLVPYACTLTLHEPLANLTSESEAMCRAATRGVISILRLCAVHAETEMTRLDVPLTLVVTLVGRSLIRQLEFLYSKYIAQEMAQQSTGNDASSKTADVWSSDEFTEAVSLLQADLEVVLLTLKRFGQKWFMAIKLHDALLKLLQFNPEHRLRGLFCVE